jgi:V/A-type H+-transporting ATPase subunit B
LFEEKFVAQSQDENRVMYSTLDLGWTLLGVLPREELDRMDDELLDKHYVAYNG